MEEGCTCYAGQGFVHSRCPVHGEIEYRTPAPDPTPELPFAEMPLGEVLVPVVSETERQQVDTLMRAFEIFKERSKVRGDLWAKFDPRDPLGHMRSKVARMDTGLSMLGWHSKEGPVKVNTELLEEAIIDDALDVVNYACFLVRLLEKNIPS